MRDKQLKAENVSPFVRPPLLLLLQLGCYCRRPFPCYVGQLQRHKTMDHYHPASTSTRGPPKFYQRSQSVVDRNGSPALDSVPLQQQQHEWPGPPVPVRSERRGGFRQRRVSIPENPAKRIIIIIIIILNLVYIDYNNQNDLDDYFFFNIIYIFYGFSSGHFGTLGPRVLASRTRQDDKKERAFFLLLPSVVVVVTHHNTRRHKR